MKIDCWLNISKSGHLKNNFFKVNYTEQPSFLLNGERHFGQAFGKFWRIIG